jgi:hypothetical protein
MVNENLYNWMFKTYGIKPAEWYRNNPNAKPGANPFLPRGAYVPLARGGETDPQKQRTAGKYDPQRGTGTLASVSPEIIEASVIEPAPNAPAETEDQKFERFYNQAKQQYEESRKGKPTYTAQEFPSAKLGPNISYMPEFSQYGGYFSNEDLGYNLSSSLYTRYKEAVDKIPLPYEDDYGQVGYRALYGTSPGGNAENYQKVLANEKARQARQQAFENLYQKPLESAKYKSTADAPSRAAYRQQLIEMGLPIKTLPEYTYFERYATPEDYEPQYYGLENVGRSDYRQQRANEAISKNFEILEQQAATGNQASQAFLNKYTSSEPEPTRGGPRGEEATPARGPRGEEMGEIARNQGPSTPVKYDEDMKMFVPNQGGGRPANIRLKNTPVREAQAPAFDEQKALVAAQAAGSYRKRGDVEDPFRAAAFG